MEAVLMTDNSKMKFVSAISAALITSWIFSSPGLTGNDKNSQPLHLSESPSSADTINYLNTRCFDNNHRLSGTKLIRSDTYGIMGGIIRTGNRLDLIDPTTLALVPYVQESGSKIHGYYIWAKCVSGNCVEEINLPEGDAKKQKISYSANWGFFLRRSLVDNDVQRKKCLKAVKHLSTLHGAKKQKELF